MYLCPHQELGTTAPQLCQFEMEDCGGHLNFFLFPLALSFKLLLMAQRRSAGTDAVLEAEASSAVALLENASR